VLDFLPQRVDVHDVGSGDFRVELSREIRMAMQRRGARADLGEIDAFGAQGVARR